MPTWDEILDEVEQLNPLKVLEDYIAALSDKTQNTTICYMSAFSIIKPPVPSPYHSIIDRDIQGFMTCSKGIKKMLWIWFCIPLVVITKQQRESSITCTKHISIFAFLSHIWP